MAIDLLADEPEGIDLLADEPEGIDLLADYPAGKVRGEKRGEIGKNRGEKKSWLQELGDQAEAATNPIGVAAGGLFQGLATPFQGAASFLPGQMAEDFSNEDFKRFFPQPRDNVEKGLQGTTELLGALGPLGKLFGSLKGLSDAARVPKVLQNATALAGTGAIATPGDSFDKTLGTGGALALGGVGKVASQIGNKLPAFLRGLTNESNTKALAEAVQKPHDILSETAGKLYNQVHGAIKRRNVNVKINPQLLDEILEYPSMQGKTHKELVKAAKLGDYEALHTLQSSLYRKGSMDKLNKDSVVQTRGENLIDLRNQINNELEGDLIQKGHADIAHVLRQGKDIYKKIQDTYFHKELPKGIGHLVREGKRLVPKKLEDIFSENSDPMRAFLKQHPEAAKHAKGIKEKEAATKALKKIFIGSGLVGGSTAGIKTLYDLLK